MNDYELKEYYNAFTDAWKIFKKHSNASDTDDYWKAVFDDSRAFTAKYDKKIALDIITGVLSELERIAKEGDQK